MKIYILKGRKVFSIMLLTCMVCATLFALTLSRPYIVGVFSDGRDLPIYSVDYPEKKVAITFDCAWGADDIPEILSALDKQDIKATFFMVGQWAEKFPEVVKMISDSGHDIGNHSFSHLRMGAISNNKISEEISLCNKKLAQITGNKIDLFRAPYGDYNNSVVGIARDLGDYTIQWDVDSLDWKPGISQDEIMSRIVTKVKPGSIILFHNDTAHTAKILPMIITALKSNGYGFLPVSKMIIREKYYIDYEGKQKRNGN